MKRYVPLFIVGLLASLCTHATQPNVIILLGDDIGYEAFGCTGDSYAQTPNVDQLAKEGFCFDRFYSTVSQCGPSRAELYSGLLPRHSGILGNSTSFEIDSATSMVDVLEPLGYQLGQTGKFHYKRGKSFQVVQGFPTICKRSDPSFSFEGAKSFIQKAQDNNQPFLMAFNSIHAHYPWNLGTVQENGIERVTVPEQYVDTPTTREVLVRHAAEVSLFDQQLGGIRTLMEEMNLTENTILICLSEQGIAMPRSKWSVYEKGNRSLCIISWPGKIEPGHSPALGLYCDILATIADYAGESAPKIDGLSLRPVIEGKSQHHRKQVSLLTVEPYQQWALVEEDGKKLVWSPDPNKQYLKPEFNEKPKNGVYDKLFSKAWTEWKEAALTNPAAAEKVNHTIHPDELELYHIDGDYNEITNLASNPENSTRIQRMHAQLKEITDPIREIVETKVKKGKKGNKK